MTRERHDADYQSKQKQLDFYGFVQNKERKERLNSLYRKENSQLRHKHYRSLEKIADKNARITAEMLDEKFEVLYAKRIRFFKRLIKEGKIPAIKKEGKYFCEGETINFLEDFFHGSRMFEYLNISRSVAYRLSEDGLLSFKTLGERTHAFSAKELEYHLENSRIYPLRMAVDANTKEISELTGREYRKLRKRVIQQFQTWARKGLIDSEKRGNNFYITKKTLLTLRDSLPSDYVFTTIKISPSTLGRRARDKTLKCKKIGGRNIFSVEQFKSLKRTIKDGEINSLNHM